MRYYPSLNGRLYTEIQPLWDHYTRTPDKSWYRKPFQPTHHINHWGDFEGPRLPAITRKHLHFNNWFRTRIREEACLPLYYTVGHRFIRITRAFPAGFKCAPQPMSLAEARAVRAHTKKMEREQERQAKLKAKEAKLKALKNKNKRK